MVEGRGARKVEASSRIRVRPLLIHTSVCLILNWAGQVFDSDSLQSVLESSRVGGVEDQSLPRRSGSESSSLLQNIKSQVDSLSLLLIQLPDVPFRLFAASAKDEFRKPLIGMWTKLEALYREQNVTIGALSQIFTLSFLCH